MDINTLKDPSKLDNPIKFLLMIFVFVATIFAGYLFDTSEQLSEIESLKTREIELREQFLDKKRQAVNLKAHKEQLKEIETAFGTLLRQLPNQSEMDALLNDVNQAGVGKGLTFDLFRPTAVEKFTEFYAEQPVTISVTGKFNEFGTFAEEISRLSRIVNMDEINIKTKNSSESIIKGEPPELVMDAVVRTYRYLDPKEIEAQKSKTTRTKTKRPAK